MPEQSSKKPKKASNHSDRQTTHNNSGAQQYSQNTAFTLEITDIDSQCRGVAKLPDGRVAFVPYSLVGEKVTALIDTNKPNYATMRLGEILLPNDSRVAPPCAVYGQCGGCALQHVEYQKQLEYKTSIIKNQLKKIAKLSETEVLPCKPSSYIYNYRNKAVFRLSTKSGSVESGFLEEGTHNLVPTDYCHICSEAINKAATLIKDFLAVEQISKYIQSFMIRELEGNVLIVLDATRSITPDIRDLVKTLKENFNDFGLYINVTKKDGRKALHHLSGSKKIAGKLGDIIYKVSPEAFLQVNSHMANTLYNDALALANIGKQDIVIDAYSGIGILSSLAAKQAHSVQAIEIVDKATSDARELAYGNNIQNLTLITGDCSLVMPNLLSEIKKNNKGKNIAVILDPPRKGCSQSVIKALLTSLPSKILYISCDSATLCRDLSELASKYKIVSIVPYDMFPQTANIECIAYLESK